ncbi:hypothetical protein, partial [Paraburkholderia ginsengiterrae]|uniref:hypothetical protein n=1 Tax=Paraburkholderia ginsengiterrae TaxID=1462993 RepID=UPI003CC64B91
MASSAGVERGREMGQGRAEARSGRALAGTAASDAAPGDVERTVARDARSPNAVYVVMTYKT